ncbi:MAG: hypothetical protein GX493_05330 [Firmicutes bacterium]|nr:hypothetical protein [Bacillota bacterium]
MGAECVVFNEKIWQRLPRSIRKVLEDAAKEISVKASKMTEELEAKQIEELKAKGMKVIGPENGLDLDAFKIKVRTVILNRFGEQYAHIYNTIEKIK